ncbi:MAG TPA: hypothetical protein EYP92_04260 [Candidatus Thioglobus sp.]|nr:hypothetical protein [Candidatus Thioglobus sp.]
MKASECPKYPSCSSAFCPVSMEGIHLKNEALCQYYRAIYKGLTVPDKIYQAIKSNEPAFLASDSDYGCMSDYRSIALVGSQTA